ncbi:MAG: type II toxin-antitoxin system HicA family toxin [Candidatus Diapherotrites archaeon]
MPKTVSGIEAVKFLCRHGFDIYSRKGSHVKLVSLERHAKAIVPMHRELSRGTLNSILRQAKLSDGEISELLGGR